MRRPPRWRLRRGFANLTLALMALVAILVVVELVLARTHWFGARRAYVRPDPFLRYRFQPNAVYWFHEENDHPITGRVNSHGWRDRQRSLEKPPGVFRVAVLGDSYVEAFQVELDSTFAALTEDRLNANERQRETGRRFEVMNFGRSGFTQSEEWLVLLQDIPRFDPDLVVLFFYPGNDIRDIHPETAATPRPFFSVSPDNELILDVSFRDSRTYRVRRWINPLQRHSALASLVVSRLVTARQARRIQETAQADKAGVDRIPGHRSLGTENPDPRYVRNYALCKRIMARMMEFCRDRHTRFLLVCMPDAYQASDVRQHQEIDPSFDPHFFDKDLSDFADRQNVGFLSLQEPFEAAAQRGVSLRWVHWNYRGHRLVAEQLEARLLTLRSR